MELITQLSLSMILSFILKAIKTVLNLSAFILRSIKAFIKNKISTEILLVVLTAFLTALFTYNADLRFDNKKTEENRKKIQQIVNAEVIENLEIANKYDRAKNQIVSDVEFVSFLQTQRFYTDSLKELLTNNFQYLSENDVYQLTVIRDKMNALNVKFDKLERQIEFRQVLRQADCNFRYFFPEEKYSAHRSLSDDFNRLFYGIKQLSFFTGNPFENLNDEFEITYAKVAVYHFDYNEEYKQVSVKCK